MTPRELSVLSVSSTAELWGAELALATYLRHRPNGFDVKVLCLSDGPLLDLLRADGISAGAASLNGRPSARQAASFVRSLAKDLRRQPPDIVYATGNKAAILCAPAAAAAGVPFVWHRVDLALRPATVRAISASSAGVLAVSSAAAGGIPESRFLGIVPPPVRLSPDFRVPEFRSQATIGSVGQLHPVKGHLDVVDAAGRLLPEFPQLRLVVAGGIHPAYPDYPSQLLDRAGTVGLGDQIELEGHVEDIEALYAGLTVLVSGTYRDPTGLGPEALGAAIAEASWAGLPVVATRGGGTAEVVEDGVTGSLVPQQAPAAMADAVARYLRDPGAAKAAGEAGASLARSRFQPRPLAQDVFSQLRQVAAI